MFTRHSSSKPNHRVGETTVVVRTVHVEHVCHLVRNTLSRLRYRVEYERLDRETNTSVEGTVFAVAERPAPANGSKGRRLALPSTLKPIADRFGSKRALNASRTCLEIQLMTNEPERDTDGKTELTTVTVGITAYTDTEDEPGQDRLEHDVSRLKAALNAFSVA